MEGALGYLCGIDQTPLSAYEPAVSMKLPKGVTPRKFARALQAWRERRSFSQRDAAEFLGISKRTLENWEQERATPRGYAVVALIRLIEPPTPARRSAETQSSLRNEDDDQHCGCGMMASTPNFALSACFTASGSNRCIRGLAAM